MLSVVIPPLTRSGSRESSRIRMTWDSGFGPKGPNGGADRHLTKSIRKPGRNPKIQKLSTPTVSLVSERIRRSALEGVPNVAKIIGARRGYRQPSASRVAIEPITPIAGRGEGAPMATPTYTSSLLLIPRELSQVRYLPPFEVGIRDSLGGAPSERHIVALYPYCTKRRPCEAKPGIFRFDKLRI